MTLPIRALVFSYLKKGGRFRSDSSLGSSSSALTCYRSVIKTRHKFGVMTLCLSFPLHGTPHFPLLQVQVPRSCATSCPTPFLGNLKLARFLFRGSLRKHFISITDRLGYSSYFLELISSVNGNYVPCIGKTKVAKTPPYYAFSSH